MDPLNAFCEGEKKQSAPELNIDQPTPIKSDRESLDDFEHVLREIPQSISNDFNSHLINLEKGQFETENSDKEHKSMSSVRAEPSLTEPNQTDDCVSLSKNFMQYEQSSGNDASTTDGPEKISSKASDKIANDFFDDSDQSQGEEDSQCQSNYNETTTQHHNDSFNQKDPEPLIPSIMPINDSAIKNMKIAEPLLPIIEPKECNKTAGPSDEENSTKISEQKYESEEDVCPPPAPVPKDYPEIGVLEPRDILTACGLYSWFHPERLHPKVEALVYWRDPKQSGIVFGSVMVVLLSLTVSSLISVVAYTSLTVLVAAISFRIYKSILQAVQKTAEGHPFNTYILPVLQNPLVSAVFQIIEEYLAVDLTLSPERVREVTDTAVTQINSAVTELRRRFLVEDLVDSLKFGLLLYVLTYIGSWFNGLTLIILGFVALFTLPKVYENNQQQIDANLDVVRAKINQVTDKVKAIIPLGKKEEGKDKSE